MDQSHDQAAHDQGTTEGPAFFRLADLPDVRLREGISARFVTGDRMMFSFVRLEPGAVMALHDHPHEQLGYVLEGSMRLLLGAEERDLVPGDAYTIPGGIAHQAIGGPNGCLALDVFAPRRDEYLEYARQQGANTR